MLRFSPDLRLRRLLGSLSEKYSLADKVKEAIQARDSVVASLKTTGKQVEDMHQKLHVTEINLATKKQAVLDLKAWLLRSEAVVQVAREVVEAP